VRVFEVWVSGGCAGVLELPHGSLERDTTHKIFLFILGNLILSFIFEKMCVDLPDMSSIKPGYLSSLSFYGLKKSDDCLLCFCLISFLS
jgi:hypothetical protein